MAKDRVKYFCNNCGFESLKWQGKCPSCNEWNSFSEEKITKNLRDTNEYVSAGEPIPLNSDEIITEERIPTGINELDRVLGGGLVIGSIVLIGGDPGIGKSTLIMQAAANIEQNVLYVTGEESINQLNMRAKRLELENSNLLVMAETNIDSICKNAKKQKTKVLIIDSIQTMFKANYENAPGTVTQVRECTMYLQQFAKSLNICVIIIGHITKEGFLAGPKILEHIVDSVLQFEGEKNHNYRIIRAQKNRFGSTNEIGIFEMQQTGLKEVLNPSKAFLGDHDQDLTGSVITSSIEGTRPVLLEVQALVTPSNFGHPQRVATGFDLRRLSILLAVLEKREKFQFSANNVFLNMAGGIKIDEPGVDLAICCSLVSSLLEQSIKNDVVIIGEVGLGGEVRGITSIEKRIKEAEKLGFKEAIIPQKNYKEIKNNTDLKITPVSDVGEVINRVFS